VRLAFTRIFAHAATAALLLVPASAESPSADLTEGLRLLDEARTTLDDKSLSAARDHFSRLTQKDSYNSDWFYYLARVEGYRVEVVAMHDKKQAGQILDDAIASVLRAISLNDKSADAHSLLADLYGRKIGLGVGFFLGPRFGPKCSAENKRALELDPNDARVQASLGRQYLNSPSMFGGDVEKAVASFRKATELDPNFDEHFIWLALAYRKKGDTASADQALHRALQLNPRSAFAQFVSSGHTP
jgi:tetratricopeptide (TPR) repeat protein